ncbi:bacterial regulatory s, gntR family protein [Mycobacterium avium subsp. avium 2285 (R)]|nr:bacterial regulatory s, gntR family protein [Mycobacterium avium subsp. avium 2285 (R)]
MIVDGNLKDGDFLPNETELMAHFGVSRPTIREAVRVLESERLVEIRRGARTGARVRVPGPEVVARPAALVLELSGATLADVMAARLGVEPVAARYFAEDGTQKARREFRRIVAAVPEAWAAGKLGAASAELHLRMVQLSGNATLGMIAGMLHEITTKHISTAIEQGDNVDKPEFERVMRSYERLATLIDDRDGDGAEAHWRKHMLNASAPLLKGRERTKVRDIL